ncbi:MAG: DUF5658 family protein [Pseudomonadota bacterium]|nr:DUF5658 family protein [Pseudomonadota bacterium]
MSLPQQEDLAPGRSGTDRRRLSLRSLVYGAWRGRRVAERRTGTQAGYVDRYPSSVVLAAVALFTLAVADAYGTLVLLEAGAQEVNPVMEALLQAEPAWFVPVKLAITAVGVLMLVLHKNFSLGQIPALKVLYGLLGLYGCLVAYEGVLLFALHRS